MITLERVEPTIGLDVRSRAPIEIVMSILRWNAVIAVVVLAHVMGAIKAGLRDHIYINERTLDALRLYEIGSAHPWLLVPWAVALTTVCLSLRPAQHRLAIRVLAYFAIATPLFWYANTLMFLGGKILIL